MKVGRAVLGKSHPLEVDEVVTVVLQCFPAHHPTKSNLEPLRSIWYDTYEASDIPAKLYSKILGLEVAIYILEEQKKIIHARFIQ